MLAIILIFIGGGIGSASRHLVSIKVAKLIRDDWPDWLAWQDFSLATLLVNILGSFVLGFLAVLYRQYICTSTPVVPSMAPSMGLLKVQLWQQVYIPLIFTGFCGGFTTFSSYMLDIYSQFLAGHFVGAGVVLSLHIVLGLLFAGLGVGLAGLLIWLIKL